MTPCSSPEFPGFPDFRANVTFVPLQFFTVVLPHRSRGCVRLLGYMIRRLLGWVDAEGNPTHEQIEFSYRVLIAEVGISRGAIAEAIQEALKYRLIRRVREPETGGEAIYALCWSEGYTDSPGNFAGFCQREAVPWPDPAHDSTAPVAKAARKNIPNAFFDYVLRQERLAVARVVGAMLFKSIQWGPGGERKVPVSLSITELSRLTRFSRHHVHEALHEALERGYIERTKEGRFDPSAGAHSHAATYRIRWTAAAVNPVVANPKHDEDAGKESAAPCTFLNQSKKVNGEVVQKGERAESKKVNGNQFKKVNDISIKRSIKNRSTAAAESSPPDAAAAEGVMAKLLAAGFDDRAARHLAGHYAAEVIEQQLAWLPQRKATTNRLGLLRRAIEGNWPRPEASTVPTANAAGALFVRHFEAALHGYAEPPAGCTPKEAELAAEFLRELVGTVPVSTESETGEWGRRFGRFVRAKSPPKPWFVFVLRLYGGEFLRQCRQGVRRQEKVSAAESRRDHERKFAARYADYLRRFKADIQRDDPDLYAAFESECQKATAGCTLSEATRAMLASEASRLSAFVVFMRGRDVRARDFWEWDRQQNPQRWQEGASVPPAA